MIDSIEIGAAINVLIEIADLETLVVGLGDVPGKSNEKTVLRESSAVTPVCVIKVEEKLIVGDEAPARYSLEGAG